MNPTRRDCLRLAVAAGLAPRLVRAAVAESLTLSIGTYSLKGIPLGEAIALVGRIGYDGIELAARPGDDAEPSKLDDARRAEIRRQLAGARLRLTALMEQLTPTADDAAHRADLDRLGRVLDLSRALDPDRPPPVQTVLGGGKWDEVKGLYRDRLGDWARTAADRGVVVAIKPHRQGAMTRPDEAVWLIDQLGDPKSLRIVYDYSHYDHRDMTVEETVRVALPKLAHVAVKDAIRRGDKVEFDLPGRGDFDYPKLLTLLHTGGYRGDICCEVSSQVSGRPGYDPAAAAQSCYQHMAGAFKASGVPRASTG